ncbi:hypothetical protein D3C73_848390 [compost metagenome]
MRHAVGLCLLLLSVGCGAAPVSADRPSASESEIAELKTLAEASCQCERSSPDNPSCWNAFNARTSALKESGGSATACAPVSTDLRCFNEDQADGGFCIVTGHSLVVGGGGQKLCSQREAQIVEATHSATLKKTGDNYEQAAEAAGTAADALIRGERLSLPDAEAGCTG